MSGSAMALAPLAAVSSRGVWTLALRRLRRDRLGMASLVVVLAFLAVSLASAVGLVAADWEREIAVSYAPPAFVHHERPAAEDAAAAALETAHSPAAQITGIDDPLRETLEQIGRELSGTSAAQRAATRPLGADKWGR
ncbi:MAG: peptide transporter permease, partial [Betaproteobacteria bacterium]|nr:peptide transporter permease [Betaproteobacteria bacterium]